VTTFVLIPGEAIAVDLPRGCTAPLVRDRLPVNRLPVDTRHDEGHSHEFDAEYDFSHDLPPAVKARELAGLLAGWC
jgi:hypothetical protein